MQNLELIQIARPSLIKLFEKTVKLVGSECDHKGCQQILPAPIVVSPFNSESPSRGMVSITILHKEIWQCSTGYGESS